MVLIIYVEQLDRYVIHMHEIEASNYCYVTMNVRLHHHLTRCLLMVIETDTLRNCIIAQL